MAAERRSLTHSRQKNFEWIIGGQTGLVCMEVSARPVPPCKSLWTFKDPRTLCDPNLCPVFKIGRFFLKCPWMKSFRRKKKTTSYVIFLQHQWVEYNWQQQVLVWPSRSWSCPSHYGADTVSLENCFAEPESLWDCFYGKANDLCLVVASRSHILFPEKLFLWTKNSRREIAPCLGSFLAPTLPVDVKGHNY